MPRKNPGNGSTTTKKTTTRRKKSNGKTATRGASTKGPSRQSEIVVSAEERHRMICEAAYLRAERRGFVGGDPHQDWLEAEGEIDALITRRPDSMPC